MSYDRSPASDTGSGNTRSEKIASFDPLGVGVNGSPGDLNARDGRNSKEKSEDKSPQLGILGLQPIGLADFGVV